MTKTFTTKIIDGEVAVQDGKADDILKEAAKHRRCKITVESYTEEREISLQQIRWIKGVLLPALSKFTGDSIAYWETRLKLTIMPDEFEPVETEVDGHKYTYIPSINTLSIEKTGIFMEGVVAHLRDDKIYGDTFHWVCLPDSSLRKKK